MYNPSYLGEAQCKQQVLERLITLQKSNVWVASPVFWDGEQGSLVGSLLQGDSLTDWERLFGLPKWLALSIDSLFVAAPDLKEGAALGLSLLDAVPVGADLRTLGSRILIELLESEKDGVVSLVSEGSLRDVLHSVADLHRHVLKETNLSLVDWRTVRHHAAVQTDDMEEGSLEAALGSCIESAAWDPRTSRSTVSDTCRYWMNAFSREAVARQSDWTTTDDHQTKELLDRLYHDAQAEASDPDAFIDVFALLEERHPEKATRLKNYIRLQGESQVEQWHRLTDVLRRVISNTRSAPQVA